MQYKFKINFSLEKANNLKLTIQECWVISYMINFFHSGEAKKTLVNGRYYYFLAYSKIIEDNEVLRVGLERMRQIMTNIRKVGVIDQLESNSPYKYYAINYDVIMETDADVVTLPGLDASLVFYLPKSKSKNHFSNIKFNSKFINYFSPAINYKLISKHGQANFENNLINNLKRILSTQVLSYFENCSITYKDSEIIINHNAPIGVVRDNCYRFERAIVDAYINIAYCNFGGQGGQDGDNKEAESETLEFAKLFNNIKIDCNINLKKYDLKLLAEKVKESSYLKGFLKMSDILKKYNEIISDRYKDFKKPGKNNKVDIINKKPTKRDYDNLELAKLYDNIF